MGRGGAMDRCSDRCGVRDRHTRCTEWYWVPRVRRYQRLGTETGYAGTRDRRCKRVYFIGNAEGESRVCYLPTPALRRYFLRPPYAKSGTDLAVTCAQGSTTRYRRPCSCPRYCPAMLLRAYNGGLQCCCSALAWRSAVLL
eukprot:1445159-Rhodomonas_salina.1